MSKSSYRQVSIFIVWASEEEGGKAELPCHGDYYVQTDVIKFGIYQGTSWSIVLNIDVNSVEQGYRIGKGKARCLMDNAPLFLLQKNHYLTVYEGGRRVGELYIED